MCRHKNTAQCTAQLKEHHGMVVHGWRCWWGWWCYGYDHDSDVDVDGTLINDAAGILSPEFVLTRNGRVSESPCFSVRSFLSGCYVFALLHSLPQAYKIYTLQSTKSLAYCYRSPKKYSSRDSMHSKTSMYCHI